MSFFNHILYIRSRFMFCFLQCRSAIHIISTCGIQGRDDDQQDGNQNSYTF